MTVTVQVEEPLEVGQFWYFRQYNPDADFTRFELEIVKLDGPDVTFALREMAPEDATWTQADTWIVPIVRLRQMLLHRAAELGE